MKYLIFIMICLTIQTNAHKPILKSLHENGIILLITNEKGFIMSKVSFKNRDRFIQLGIVISTLRKIKGLSQEQLAEKAQISRSLVSLIESPGTASGFSMEAFFNIADALEIDPADLFKSSVLLEKFGTKP